MLETISGQLKDIKSDPADLSILEKVPESEVQLQYEALKDRYTKVQLPFEYKTRY